eukprot:CCRYP_006507-RB/>CCRYP_006507-RB protein AED:0.44 eAED:1.00 QI:0/0/0/1/0/0/2/0/112
MFTGSASSTGGSAALLKKDISDMGMRKYNDFSPSGNAGSLPIRIEKSSAVDDKTHAVPTKPLDLDENAVTPITSGGIQSNVKLDKVRIAAFGNIDFSFGKLGLDRTGLETFR